MRVQAVEIFLSVDLNLPPGPLWRGKIRSKSDDKADWLEFGRLQTASWWWWTGTRPYSLSPLPMQASE